MRHTIFILLFLGVIPSVRAQYEQLATLKNHRVPGYYSAGHESRASAISSRVDKAMDYYQTLLSFQPEVTLLVLSAADWKTYTAEALVYGMPHFVNKTKTLVVAAEDNALWKSFLPPLDQLPEAIRPQIQAVYENGDQISMHAFFDLLALHELGHAFHAQAGLVMQRVWMGELFTNILLHTYIAENEPSSLPALTLFPRMVVSGGAKEYTYTTLKDIEENYVTVGSRFPKNYGWYQCRWHVAAGVIYDSGGKQVSRKLWDALKNQREILANEQLISLLSGVDKSIGDMVVNWDRDTVK